MSDVGREGAPGREEVLDARMRRIKRKILVLSGKGGVGKSTVAANLAVALTLAGRDVGLLDVDCHGPSIPKLLGLEGSRVELSAGAMRPVTFDGRLKVMSLGFLLGGPADAVIWRGPMKMQVIRQFLRDVDWGDLDDLVIDFPPGTGDEPLSVAQLVPDATGAVIVTTPQEVALADVRRCIAFCRRLSIPVVGVVENMSGFVCPRCGERVDIFKRGGGETMAREAGVPYLGRIPIDPVVVETTDAGRPVVLADPHGETAKAFLRVAAPILELGAGPPEPAERQHTSPDKEKTHMRIAIPIANGRLAMHFGHCETFAFVDVDAESKRVTAQTSEAAPDHQPGLLPQWLAERGVDVVITGGMGRRALALFQQQNIRVVVGAPSETPETVAARFLDGSLETGDNVCDH